jgi:sortase A
MWFGLGFVGVGLSLLGYVDWQLYGTNWVSHKKQERIVSEVQKKWDIAPSSTLTRNGTPVVQVGEGQVSALIRIPEFGDDYVVPVLEGTSDKVLAAGFGHFDGTADPGQVGNYALAAHRVTHGEPLRDMPKLEAGDEIIVETVYATYTYVLTSGGEDLRVSFKDGWVVSPLPHNPRRNGVEPAQIQGQKLITLTTCAELFHTDNRMIVFGHLVDTTPR